jgi:hypothetical protein
MGMGGVGGSTLSNPASYGSGLPATNTGIPTTTAPPAASAPPPPPDYASLIASDPGYQQLLADLTAQGIASQASRTAAQQRAAVQFGEVPNGLSAAELGLTGDLSALNDPTIAAAASNNPYSTEARLSQTHTDALRSIMNSLAASGMLHSGEAGFQLNRENTNYGQGQYDATQKLLDYLSQVQSAFLTSQQQAALAREQGLEAALARIMSMYPNGFGGQNPNPTPTPPPTGTPVGDPYAPPNSTESSPYSFGQGGKQ